ncbi:hypothetical protein HPB50_017731 [Hyalomma asiaticum]|uniref:Uncharacterized protein n=1 Tax=Hyalomma asiaticum TaxID=266040 RepID=A0ACB7SZF4_HYAAI|nr:hypothetical protein HPB50_017731 [Hyalomma asiaticum]
MRVAVSVWTRVAHQAQEAAIALALINPKCATVLSDSRTVVRNYTRGRVCVAAMWVLHAVNLSR